MQVRPMPSCGVCVSVCLSACLLRSWILSSGVIVSSKFFSLSCSQIILAFFISNVSNILTGTPPNTVVECRWVGTNCDSGRWLLLDVRARNNCDGRPYSVWHRWRHISESLFITAYSMDEYAKEKRTEQNLIVCSGKSEAELTNTKRWHSR